MDNGTAQALLMFLRERWQEFETHCEHLGVEENVS